MCMHTGAGTQAIAEAFMTVMAILVPHYIIGIALGAGVYGMFMLCEGFFIVKRDIPDYWYAPLLPMKTALNLIDTVLSGYRHISCAVMRSIAFAGSGATTLRSTRTRSGSG